MPLTTFGHQRTEEYVIKAYVKDMKGPKYFLSIIAAYENDVMNRSSSTKCYSKNEFKMKIKNRSYLHITKWKLIQYDCLYFFTLVS